MAEVSLQRSQLEELMQSLARSRDENVVVDIEAAVRVALQQTAITGSAEPLVATLKQSDERLARYNQPRLEGVRRAIARDLDRVKSAGVADVATLAIKLDEAIRMIDDLPLLEAPPPPRGDVARKPPRAAAAASAASSVEQGMHWLDQAHDATLRFFGQAWDEVRSLVRVTRIDHPDAVLMAPDQAFFLRENLKLRLLNARLALLSRQFDDRAERRAARAEFARSLFRSSARAAPPWRQSWCARSVRRPGRAACRAPTTRWRPWRRPKPGAERRRCARSSGSSCCSPWRWSRRRRSAPTTGW